MFTFELTSTTHESSCSLVKTKGSYVYEGSNHRRRSRVVPALCTLILDKVRRPGCLPPCSWSHLCDGSTWYWQVPLCEAIS